MVIGVYFAFEGTATAVYVSFSLHAGSVLSTAVKLFLSDVFRSTLDKVPIFGRQDQNSLSRHVSGTLPARID